METKTNRNAETCEINVNMIFGMIKRDRLILIATAILCILAIAMIIIVSFAKSPPRPTEIQEQVVQTNRPENSIISYEPGTQVRLFEQLTSERLLTPSDLQARIRIVSSIPTGSGTLLVSEKVRLDYLSSPDFFQAEILTTDIVSAKQEVIAWLTSQGLSQSGICELPIMFYLGQSPYEEFTKTKQLFSPLAPGC